MAKRIGCYPQPNNHPDPEERMQADVVDGPDGQIHDLFCLSIKYKDMACTCMDAGYPYPDPTPAKDLVAGDVA